MALGALWHIAGGGAIQLDVRCTGHGDVMTAGTQWVDVPDDAATPIARSAGTGPSILSLHTE